MREKENSPILSYVKVVATFIIIALLNVAAWYIFFNPSGIMRLYTPMYGFSLVMGFLASVILLSDIADYWPVRVRSDGALSLLQGMSLTALSVVLAGTIIYGVFYNFIGKFGITYFSPAALIATGETGAEAYSARENASTAIIYFFTVFIWIAKVWRLGFGKWPWVSDSAGVIAFSRFSVVMFFSIIAYVILFNPHVGYLFYPPQKMAAVAPWWESLADTNSAYVHLGWIVSCVAVLILSETLWEGNPWKALIDRDRKGISEGSLLSGVGTFVGSTIMGFVFFLVMVKGMEMYWGKPFMGGQYVDAPYFRYLHAGEMAGFLILGALIVRVYLANIMQGGPFIARAMVRTLVAIALGFVLMWFYYTPGPAIFGQVPGIAQPEDTPLCWAFFMISFVLVHKNFFLARPVGGGK